MELLLDNPPLLEDCLSRALVAAVICNNPSNIGMLVIKGAPNVTEAIELAVNELKHNAHAMLLLMMAVMKNDCNLVQKMFTVQENDNELQEVKKALAEKTVSTLLPLEVACRWQNKAVAEELLLRTDVYQNEGTVFWRCLGLHVVKMDIQFNELNAIPGTLLELPNLVNLNISNNKLTTFPHLGKWSQSLAILNVSFNRLNTIPGEPTASSINTLNLANNELSAVPLCICSFTTLQFLDLSNNVGILTLPMQMYKLKELRYLNLKGLINLSGIPKSIQHDSQKVIGYFKSKSLPTTGYYRMKLMLVGKQNRGKTTLAARLQGRSCGNTSTVGVDVNEWEYKPSIGKKSFQFSIWDFGGQEEYYATHQCFLSERALYLVLFNLLHGVEGVKEMIPWLNNIALRAPNSCVLIVGTHLDEIPAAQRKEKADKLLQKAADIAGGFCNKLQIYQVMAVGLKDPLEGVTDLRDSIYQCAAEYKFSNGEFVMGQKIPISYSKLNKQILWFQKRARQCNLIPIMNKEEFKALVKDLSLTDIHGDNELKLATTFLTDIGTLLYYDDRSHHLDELYFLDPQWLCDMMAKVVTVKEQNPFVSNGVLATRDVPFLFRGEKFPWQYFKQYVALLDRFDIALALDRNRILIPSMLSEVRPEGVDVAEPHEMPFYTRLVIFNSPTTPSGFWSRLISRILHAIPGVRRTTLPEGASDLNPESFVVINSVDQVQSTTFTHLSNESTVFNPSISISISDANSSTPLTSISDAQLQAKLLYWQTGLFYHNNKVFFRVESLSHTKHKKEGVMITATFSVLGRALVSQILDFIGGLVKDWYPGLQDRGPLQQIVLCCECMRLKRNSPYQFDVQSCLSLIGQNMASIECMYSQDPSENHSVLLADIVPDLLLQDISVKYLLNISELDYKEEENLVLGTGGFGKVYRGRCHGKSVAIKRYLKGDEALSELRKEAMILQQFHHPCLVCLVGVCVHPIMAMVLEEAPMGSLESPLIKARLPIHRLVIHRIAVQVAAALNFLHEGGIIFRDLKAANVLLWSLDPESLCHCKVTDFGIATNLTPIGARGIIGTKGFIAPEVLHVGKKREQSLYDHKADIFSFGMFLYQMIYRRHPFHDMLPVRIDSAVENGERPRLMQCCWQADPRNRPATAEIIDKLCLSSFQSLISKKYFLKLALVTVKVRSGTKESNPYTESTSSEHVSRVPHADSGSGFVGPFPSGFTPFFLMFGRQAKLPLDIIYGSTPTEPQPVHEYAKNLKRSLEDAYSRAYLKIKADLKSRHLNILPNFTRVDFYWGLSMWSSRAHTIGVKDRDGRWDRASCLVPLADLFNMALHQEQVNVVCNTNEASTHFECRTSKPLAAGEQLPELNQELPDYAQRTKLAQKLSVLSNTVFQLSRPQDPFFTVKELLIAFRLIEGAPSDVKAAGLDPNGSFAKVQVNRLIY
eukprot:Em0022g773a